MAVSFMHIHTLTIAQIQQHSHDPYVAILTCKPERGFCPSPISSMHVNSSRAFQSQQNARDVSSAAQTRPKKASFIQSVNVHLPFTSQ